MKLPIALAAALAVCAATASAQEPVTLGVKAGLNFSTINIDEEVEFFEASTRTGLVVGLFASAPLTPRIALQPEVLYSQKGAKFDDADATLNLDYLEIPVLADIRLTEGPARVSFMVGPSFAFRSRARLDVGEGEEEESEDFADQIESVDVGLVTGVAVTSGQFVVDGRYTWGLSNVGKEDALEEDSRNRTLSITVGWRFR